MNSLSTFPLFPLSAHLLPGGRMSLRIFEPRYVRMVKEACASDSGFGICMVNAKGDKHKNEHIYPIGTFVKVVDFDLMEDGILGITVEGRKAFKIESVITQSDELRVGTCHWLNAWPEPSKDLNIAPLDERLIEIFEQYKELENLYSKPKFNDPVWVIYRWLELLPVEADRKQQLLHQKDCVKALDFLTSLVE